MSDFSLTLVLQKNQAKIIYDMAKVNIKSEKLTPSGGIFHVRECFSRFVSPVIDKELGLRSSSYGYQYSEIVDALSCVYFCGGHWRPYCRYREPRRQCQRALSPTGHAGANIHEPRV